MPNPLTVLRTEWLKIKHYRPFWVLLSLYPVSLVGVVAMATRGRMYAHDAATNIPNGEAVFASHDPFSYPHAWQTVSYIAAWMQFIPALLIILNVTNEFTFRSHRQNLLEGWSRAQFLGAKLALVVALTLFCGLNVVVFTGAAAGYLGFVPSPEGLEFVGFLLLQTLLYGVFALFLAFLIRRAALALAAFSMYTVFLEKIVGFFVNRRFPGYGDMLPLHVADALVPAPYWKDLAKRLPSNITELNSPIEQTLLVAAAVYLVLFVGLLAYRFQREDL